MMAESTLLITGAVGNIDTVNSELVKIHTRKLLLPLSFSLGLGAIGSVFLVLLWSNIDEEKRNILRGASMTASPLSLVFHRAGRGGFQDQDYRVPSLAFFSPARSFV